MVIRYSTLAGNSVSNAGGPNAGGAVYNLFRVAPGSPAADAAAGATMTVDSSILSGSRDGATVVSDCETGTYTASFTSGHDVVETPGSCTFDDNDQAADPQLGLVSDNGGPTRTMAIAATSVAVDMGNTGKPTPLDQRVQVRDALPDVGAYELHALPTLPATTFAPLQNMRVAADGPPLSQDFTLSLDNHSIYELLIVTARSSNQTVLPSDHLVIDPDCGRGAAHYTCRLTVTPAGKGGTVTVTLVATDQFGRSASTSFLLDLDTRPLAIDQFLSTVAGVTFSGSLPALDIDGDPLTFSIDTPPAHGEAVVTDAAAGVFRYMPAAGYSGADSFTFVANDGLTSSAAATVTIDVSAPPTDDDAPPADDDTPPSGDDTPPGNNDNPPVDDGDTPPDRSPPPERSGGGGGLGTLALCILLGLGFGRRGRERPHAARQVTVRARRSLRNATCFRDLLRLCIQAGLQRALRPRRRR